MSGGAPGALLDSSPILAEEVAAKQRAIIKTVYRLKIGEVLRLA
jgi:hypothetical protein